MTTSVLANKESAESHHKVKSTEQASEGESELNSGVKGITRRMTRELANIQDRRSFGYVAKWRSIASPPPMQPADGAVEDKQPAVGSRFCFFYLRAFSFNLLNHRSYRFSVSRREGVAFLSCDVIFALLSRAMIRKFSSKGYLARARGDE